jgi:diguanylate cyclase (GGDEF)-like protein
VAWLLAAIALVAALPPLGVAYFALQELVAQRQQEQHDALLRRALAVAGVVAREFDSGREVLNALRAAYAESLQSQGEPEAALRHVHAFATELAARHDHIASISATTADGQRLFHSGQPWGAPLPPSAIRAHEAEVFSAGRTVIAPVTLGPLTGQYVVAVAGPLELGGPGRLSLRVALRQTKLGDALRSLHLQPPLQVMVIDPAGFVAACTGDEAQCLGRASAPGQLRGMAESRTGVFAVQPDRAPALWSALSRVADTSWWVAATVPQGLVAEQAARPTRELAVWGVAVALVGALAAYALGAKLTHDLRAVARDGAEPPDTAFLELRAIDKRIRRTNERLLGARHDALTGLPGRELLLERLAQMVARSHAAELAVAVLFVDLDGFKALNDRRGHAAGDRGLVQVAQALRQVTRERDVLGRLGGDEFLVALAAPLDEVMSHARRVAQRIQAGIGDADAELGATIGLTLARPGEALGAVVDRADAAMLQAKQACRGSVAVA